MPLAKFNKSVFSLLIIAIAVISCKKSSNQVAADVYIAGNINTSVGASNSAAYWKNDVPIPLTDTLSGLANAIVVKGADIYAAGYTFKGNNNYGLNGNDTLNQEPLTGTYWHNGVAATVGLNTICTAIAVSGNDIYVAGYSYIPVSNKNGGFIQYPATENTTGMYWKNGSATTLGANTMCTSITVVGADVYIAGSINNSAAYWKNGIPTMLAGNTSGSIANAISVEGSIYVAGTINVAPYSSYAAYWKNGVKYQLAPDISTANALAISNGSVYIAGSLGTKAVYWKDGTATLLQDGPSEPDLAKAIAVNGNTVYTAGYAGLSSVYWRNGIPALLDISGTANGIAVVLK